MSLPDRIDRRHFTTQLAWGAGGLAATMAPLSAISAAQEKPAAAQGKPDAKKPDEVAAAPELPPPEVILLTYLTRRHPSDHYDEAALQGIYRDIRGDVARGKQLSEFPLRNSDEPAFVFAAYRNQVPEGEQKKREGTK